MSEGAGAVDAYIAALPVAVRGEVEGVRARIRAAVPETTESISYGIPTFSLDGRYLVYLAGWKHHLSLYPVPDADASLKAEIAPYRAARGTLRFPLGQAIPEGLVERVVRALLEERRSSAG